MTLHPPRALNGIALTLVAMAILPNLDVVAKFLGQQGIPVIEVVWARLFFSALITLPLVSARLGVRALWPREPAIHSVRAVFLAGSTGLFFWALIYLPIADTLAIFFVQPLVITLLSPFMLGEHVGIRRWSAVAVGFLGTLIIIRPGFQVLNPGHLLALGAGISMALYMVITRRVAGRQDALATTFHTNAAGALIVSLALPFIWVQPGLQQWGEFVLLALIATAGHYLLVRAYDFAEASLLAPLGYTEMISAVAVSWWFFGDFPDRWTFLGVGILIASAIYIAYREKVRASKQPMITAEH